MGPENQEDLENRAEQVLDDFLRLDEAEIDAVYAETGSGENATKRVRELADRAAELGATEYRPQPRHLAEALATLAQLELPFEIEPGPQAPRILLIDADKDRSILRAGLFWERECRIEIARSPFDGLVRLEAGGIQLVIIDYWATTKEEKDHLLMLQGFNLQVPVINVAAWSNLLQSDRRRLNRDLLRIAARLFRKPMPNRLPEKRPARSQEPPISVQQEFDVG